MTDELDDLLNSMSQNLHGTRASTLSMPSGAPPPPPSSSITTHDSELDDLLGQLEGSSVATNPSKSAITAPTVGGSSNKDNFEKLLKEFTMHEAKSGNAGDSKKTPQKVAYEATKVEPKASATTGAKPLNTGQIDEIDAIIMGMDFSANAEINVGVCFQCRQPIPKSADYLDVKGKTYHAEHWQCNGCRRPLATSDFIERLGVPFCIPCFQERFTTKCNRCNTSIMTPQAVVANGRRFHPACFTCQVCRKTLDNLFFERDGSTFCETHFVEKYVPHCSTCDKAVVGPVTIAIGREYHPGCFKCYKCRTDISSRFVDYKGTPLCVNCAPQTVLESSESSLRTYGEHELRAKPVHST